MKYGIEVSWYHEGGVQQRLFEPVMHIVISGGPKKRTEIKRLISQKTHFATL
jgi:hypothetical protein